MDGLVNLITGGVDFFSDPGGFITRILCNFLYAFINGLYAQAVNVLGTISVSSMLTADFDKIFGGSGGLYNAVTAVETGVIHNIARSILALVMLVQLVKISQRVDGSATFPAVKEVVTLAVYYVIISYLITNAGKICLAIYDDIAVVTSKISSTVTTTAASEALKSWVDIGFSNENAESYLAAAFPLLLAGVIVFIVALIAVVISFLMVYARGIQLYIFAMFSPIPLALLGFDETRQMGIGFIRNFVALCLAGAATVFILMAFPLVLQTVLDGLQFSPDKIANLGQILVIPIQMIAISLVLCFSLIRCGGWMNQILGQ